MSFSDSSVIEEVVAFSDTGAANTCWKDVIAVTSKLSSIADIMCRAVGIDVMKGCLPSNIEQL
ncbi:hypothetical protein [Photobacterium sp. J15]|uniref:hypothetical protein n=1 Tax=Photobacterium sp. J15 TaxID=265901 RepID=UPI0018DC233F|nr:hypothetical protein [Photobacterium sp. J15]